MRGPYVLGLAILLCAIAHSPLPPQEIKTSSQTSVGASQTIEIILRDGRSGKPMVGKASHVNVWLGKGRKTAIVIGTEKDRLARVELTQDETQVNVRDSADEGLPSVANPVLRYNDSIWINVPYAWCAPGGSNYSWLARKELSSREILQRGYVSPNTCGNTAMTPKPGQIVLYVRPLTFWESFKE